MDKSTKLYTRAIRYYNEGYIDKAMEYCEKSISENLKNTSAINLKGLLYYIKGELESAQALWKMNYQVNKDLVAKKYLQDSKNDEEKKILYNSALKLIIELRVREALQVLEKCRESDFNSINTNNYIALCYTKVGEYDRALKHINLVEKTDKRNKAASDNKKELIALGAVSREWNVKYASIGVAVLAIMIIVSVVLINIDRSSSFVADSGNESVKAVLSSSLPNNDTSELDKVNNGIKEQQEKSKADIFQSTDLESALGNKEYDKMYDLFSYWRHKNISINQKTLLIKTRDILSKEGVEFFYNTGREALSVKDYKKAVNYFNKSLSFSEGHYLDSHIIYLLAVSYKNAFDIESAIGFYKQYDSKYPDGDYEEAVLYELAIIYKDIDNNESKKFGRKLSELYPNSMYNNSIIKGILSR